MNTSVNAQNQATVVLKEMLFEPAQPFDDKAFQDAYVNTRLYLDSKGKEFTEANLKSEAEGIKKIAFDPTYADKMVESDGSMLSDKRKMTRAAILIAAIIAIIYFLTQHTA